MSDRLKLLEKYKLEDELYSKVFDSFSLEKYQDLHSKIKAKFKNFKKQNLDTFVNKKLGNYIFLDILEQGEDYCRYIAKKHSRSNHNLVVITLKSIAQTDQPSFEDIIEKNLLKRFENPNIIHLIDSGILFDYGCLYDIYGFYDGITFYELEDQIENYLTPELVLELGISILEKIRKVHSTFRTPFNITLRGVNIKKNLHFNHVGELKLSKFEIPYFRNKSLYTDEQVREAVDANKGFSFAPEILRQEMYTPKSDQFKIGIFLWELFSKKDFFNYEDNFLDQLEQYVYRPVEGEKLNFSGELDKILQMALHPNPDKRFEHCEQLASRLKSLRDQISSGGDEFSLNKFFEQRLNDHKLEWILKSMYYQEVGSEQAHLEVEEISKVATFSFLMDDNSDKSWLLI